MYKDRKTLLRRALLAFTIFTAIFVVISYVDHHAIDMGALEMGWLGLFFGFGVIFAYDYLQKQRKV